jgi:hypothetical protein
LKALHQNWKELVNDCILVILLCGTVGIAVKFATFFDKWVYFPTFPNIVDAAFLVLSVIYLIWRIKK